MNSLMVIMFAVVGLSGKGFAVACSRVEERWRHKHSPSQLHGSCHGYRFLWPRHRLFYLGWAGPLWFSQDKPRSEQNYGHVGILDAGLHAVHHRCLPSDWTDLV